MINKIKNLSRYKKQIIMFLTDCILLIGILFASYSLRLDYWYFPEDDTLRLILAAPIIGIPIFVKLGMYQLVIRHVDLKGLWTLIQAVSLYAIIWGLVGFFSQADFAKQRGFDVGVIPRSIIIINWLLAIIIIGGSRIIAKFFLNYNFISKSDNLNIGKNRVLIYGAGAAGVHGRHAQGAQGPRRCCG